MKEESATDMMILPTSLRCRSLRPELMDDPDLDPRLHREALIGLARLNRFGFASAMIWSHLKPLVERREITVVDVATGSGDVLKSLARRAPGRVRGVGIDVSHEAVAAARRGAPPGIEFLQTDVMDPDLPLPTADVVMCSLFLHHLQTEQVPPLLARMGRAAALLVIVSDLERSALNWPMVGMAARMVTRSCIVHFDSLRSVEGSWTKAELSDLARQAGLREVRVERRFPARLVLVARPP